MPSPGCNQSGLLDSIKAVGENEDNINNVSDNMPKVVTVSDNIADVNTVVDNIEDVNTVADDIEEVKVVADNIVAVVAVPDALVQMEQIEESVTATAITVASNAQTVQDSTNAILALESVAWVATDVTDDEAELLMTYNDLSNIDEIAIVDGDLIITHL